MHSKISRNVIPNEKTKKKNDVAEYLWSGGYLMKTV